jgi:hypothetical protein
LANVVSGLTVQGKEGFWRCSGGNGQNEETKEEKMTRVIRSRMGILLKANVRGRANGTALAAEYYHESDGCPIALITHQPS